MIEWSEALIRGKIRTDMAVRVDRGEVVDLTTYAREFLREHNDIAGSDVGFYQTIAVRFVTESAAAMVDTYEKQERKGSAQVQNTLPGFEKLQKAYSVMRQGRRVLVPVMMMTAEEAEARVALYESAMAGYATHIKEWRQIIPILRKADAS